MNLSSKIIIGTVQFGLEYGINSVGGQMNEQEVFKILDFANSQHVLTLDTAAAYGNSEERIGKYLKLYPDVNFRIITKLLLNQGITPIDSLNKSLQRLNLGLVDTIMFHNFEDFKRTKKSEIESLLLLKGEKFNKLGISVYTNDQIDEICETDLFEVVQIPFNALDNEKIRGQFLKKLKSKNIETHTRSVFLQGLFFMQDEKIPLKLTPLIKYLKQIETIAQKYQIEKNVLALHYALSKTYIDRVLIGVDSIEQLNKNIEMTKIEVPQEALNSIDQITVNESYLLNPAIWNN